MVTPTTDPFDHECIVDHCSGVAYCRSYNVCDRHRIQVTRYLQVCHKLNIPLEVATYHGPHSPRHTSRAELLFAAMLFDTWATSASDLELIILMNGM